MSITAVLLTELVALQALALLISVPLDRHRPADLAASTLRRKQGSLRARLPVILTNLVLLVTATALTLPWVEPWLDRAWPGVPMLVAQAAVLLLVDDAWFYGLHRAMHSSKLLYRLHRMHHEAYAPVPAEAIYAHPGEVTLVMIGPALGMAVIAALIGPVSSAAFVGAMTWKLVHELDLHSGLNTVLGLPFSAPVAHHDLHHRRPNDGNYGSTTVLWDTVWGTRVG